MSIFSRARTRTARDPRVAILAAILILGAQFIGVAHWHRVSSSAHIASQGELSLDSSLCAVCQLAFHSSFNPSARPALYHAALATRLTIWIVSDTFLSPRSVSTPTRAPPFTA